MKTRNDFMLFFLQGLAHTQCLRRDARSGAGYWRIATNKPTNAHWPFIKVLIQVILYEDPSVLCPLHISQSDTPIGLRCSWRQIATKLSDVASGLHSHWPNGAVRTFASVGTRESYNIVRLPGWYDEGVLFIYNSQLRCTRSAPDRPAASGSIKHV